ncbi:MAG: hypothetical protein LH702_25735, partial [Phormidesmis sp. CAN_BIN44]|nr:hypothetical protein [Phormidesmis sp. CAN_BIN44]
MFWYGKPSDPTENTSVAWGRIKVWLRSTSPTSGEIDGAGEGEQKGRMVLLNAIAPLQNVSQQTIYSIAPRTKITVQSHCRAISS